jgi:hypothetical protein
MAPIKSPRRTWWPSASSSIPVVSPSQPVAAASPLRLHPAALPYSSSPSQRGVRSWSSWCCASAVDRESGLPLAGLCWKVTTRRWLGPWVNSWLNLTKGSICSYGGPLSALGRGPLQSTWISTGSTSLQRRGLVTVDVGAGGECVWQRGWPTVCVRLVLRRELGLVGSLVSSSGFVWWTRRRLTTGAIMRCW